MRGLHSAHRAQAQHVQVLPPRHTTGAHFLIFYVPESYIMYLSDFCRFLLCTCGWERRGDRGEAGEGRGPERGG
jgi:hypothetical protein